MGFVLKVIEGAGKGESFSFDGGEVRLGRTADNDVVVRDPASSRSHCRIVERGSARLLEDLESANGTLLNDEPVTRPQALSSGDRITIGDAVMVYESDDVDANATLLKPPASVADDTTQPPSGARRKTGAALARAPQRPARAPSRPAPVDDEPAGTVDDGDEDEALDGADAGAPEGEEGPASSTMDFDVPPPKALAQRRAAPPVRAPRERSGGAVVPVVSAAERARQRRELSRSAGGKLLLVWSDLPKAGRIVLGVVGAALLLGFAALVVVSLVGDRGPQRVEPVELVPNADPIADSFGLGPGVVFSTPDMKSFTFTAASPTRIVGVLHYQAKDISLDEVTVELNGVQLGSVPPDGLDADQRELDATLPATVLKAGELNQLVFDNVQNPPGSETWRIWNLWVEIIPVPEMSTEDATQAAREQMDRAQKFYENRNIGAENLFRSWKNYREAWLLLESTPNRPEELLSLARTRMQEIRPELDSRCAAMLMSFKQVVSHRNPDIDKARSVLEGVSAYFPTREHYCHNVAHGLLATLDDFSSM